MVSFKRRSFQPELMDSPDIPARVLQHNLGELDFLNRYFGGHSISLQGIKRLVTSRDKVYHIADLGCGSGDTLRYIAQWARKNSFKVKLTGVDINADAIDYLKENCSAYPEITGVVSSYMDYLKTASRIDIVHCSLFCHHLDQAALHELFLFLNSQAIDFVINDLQRSRIAYWGAWLMPRLLNGTHLSKHDGPVSVLNAFKRNELKVLLQDAGIAHLSIKWRWAFRYLVTVKTGQSGNR